MFDNDTDKIYVNGFVKKAVLLETDSSRNELIPFETAVMSILCEVSFDTFYLE